MVAGREGTDLRKSDAITGRMIGHSELYLKVAEILSTPLAVHSWWP